MPEILSRIDRLRETAAGPADSLLLGQGRRGPVAIPARYANRHVLIAGASGTGKTTTVGALCERFAAIGTPTLVVDAKGDLEGLARHGAGVVWCPFGERGRRRRLDLSAMGPDLIARALDLSEAQSGALEVAFLVAEAEQLPLHSLADLRALLRHCAAHAARISATIGLISAASLGAVQRALIRLERTAGDAFGRPGLDPAEADDGAGRITIYSAAGLTRAHGLYGAACAYILSDLFDRAPEVGDAARPRLAVVIDEAHLMFDAAPPAIVRRMEQVARLIRSKGIALVFATQSPADLPDAIAGQLATRIQHGLRATTPAQQRAVRVAAETLPIAAGIRAREEIGRLAVGEALVSVPDGHGRPTPVDIVRLDRGRLDLSPLAPWEIERDTVEERPRAELLAIRPVPRHRNHFSRWAPF